MTRLMSFCTRPTVAAKMAVIAPMKVTTVSAVCDSSKIGDSRASMKTPAVTMVAAWISAETGVGPSMASGSQVCSGTCADLPIAPRKRSRHTTVSAPALSRCQPRKVSTVSACAAASPAAASAPWPPAGRKLCALAKMVSKLTEPNSTNTPKMPSTKPKSPTRLTTKALMAAAQADGFLYQKPISR